MQENNLTNDVKHKHKKKYPNLKSSQTLYKLNVDCINDTQMVNAGHIKRSKSINMLKSTKETNEKLHLKNYAKNHEELTLSVDNDINCTKKRDKFLSMLKLNQKSSKFSKFKKSASNLNSPTALDFKAQGNYIFFSLFLIDFFSKESLFLC